MEIISFQSNRSVQRSLPCDDALLVLMPGRHVPKAPPAPASELTYRASPAALSTTVASVSPETDAEGEGDDAPAPEPAADDEVMVAEPTPDPKGQKADAAPAPCALIGPGFDVPRGPFLESLLLDPTGSGAPPFLATNSRFQTFLASPRLVPRSGTARLLRLLSDLDGWLLERDDRPSPASLDAALVAFAGALNDDPNVDLNTVDLSGLAPLWSQLVDILCASLLLPDMVPTAQRATRLLLVAGLATRRRHIAVQFDDDEMIFRLLRHRYPVLPSPICGEALGLRVDPIKLVRRVSVSDLFVVRSEWRCYEAAEIADIINVLPHEKLEASVLSIDEREVTTTELRDQTTREEQRQEDTNRSELSEEAKRNVQLAVHVQGQVNTSGQYGPTKVDTTVGAALDYSVADSTSRAVKIARDSVSGAVRSVSTTVRAERVQRLLSRTEQANRHVLDNVSDDPISGVYRWVNRVDRYQVVRYPLRTQLEFQLPEPGNALYRLLTQPPDLDADDPGAFNVKLEEINRANWQQLASLYKVVGVPAPPAEDRSVATTLHAVAQAVPKDSSTVWNPPDVTAKDDVVIPPGYVADRLTGNMRAEPILAKWHRERTGGAGFDDLEGWHALHVMLYAAGKKVLHWWNPLPGGGVSGNSVQYTNKPPTSLMMAGDGADLDEALLQVRDKLPVMVRAEGALSVTASVTVHCMLSAEAYEQWKLQVFNALLDAYQERVRVYRAALARRAATTAEHGGLANEPSPLRSAQLISGEIKRLVVAWLLDESPFDGRPAVDDEPDADHPDEHTNLDRARDVAPTIQFFEQAFEWQNLTYVCHAPFWGRPSGLDRRRLVQAADRALSDFLAAGSVRVVVPVRPGFQDAVLHYLTCRQIWLGLPMPLVDDPLYVSIAQEIRDQMLPPKDGVPAESWEAVLPTPFRILDTAALPHNQNGTLGKPPHEPDPKVCADLPAAP